MGTCIENIFYPDYPVHEMQELLYDVYVEDYGKNNAKLIKRRQANTQYLFDSDPILTMAFLKDYQMLFHDSEIEDRTFSEYRDFIALQKKKLPKVQENYYELLCAIYKLKDKSLFKDVLALDFDSFSYFSDFLLKNRDCSENIKDRIRLRREKYIHDCKKLGVRILTTKKEIAYLMEARNMYYYEEILFYLNDSKWGKRILNNFYQKGINISITSLATAMSGVRIASCAPYHLLRDKKGGTLVYYPIIKNRKYAGFDRLFYHENRHAIEYGKNHSGLSLRNPEKYVLTNEIRTEINAIMDSEKMEKYILFSNDPLTDVTFNTYERYLPYTGEFFTDNLDILNKLAIRGDMDGFYEKFGFTLLRKMNDYLESIPSEVIHSGRYDFDYISKGTELVKKHIKK